MIIDARKFSGNDEYQAYSNNGALMSALETVEVGGYLSVDQFIDAYGDVLPVATIRGTMSIYAPRIGGFKTKVVKGKLIITRVA